MKLHILGHVPWLDSQMLYHAQARLGVEGLLTILAPARAVRVHRLSPGPRAGGGPRATAGSGASRCSAVRSGGGAVFLDGRSAVLPARSPQGQPGLAGRQGRPSTGGSSSPWPPRTRDLGVPARYRPVNDIVTEAGRKISGTGVAEIGDSVVLVGNLIADFDYETMVRVLRVPDEKYRDKVLPEHAGEPDHAPARDGPGLHARGADTGSCQTVRVGPRPP